MLYRGFYRGLKMLHQVMNDSERVFEGMIMENISIDDIQFGFIPGRGTIDAIFIVRQLQEIYLLKDRDLYLVFIDLEKALYRVPRDVVQWAMRKLGVEEWLVRVIMKMYELDTV